MTLRQIQRLIERGEYEMSEKVRTLIEEGFFGEDDLVECVLTAERIYKTEQDERHESIDRKKICPPRSRHPGTPLLHRR